MFHEADSYGIISDNGSWNGMTAHVMNGIAEIGVAGFLFTQERSEVVAYTDSLAFIR